MDEISLNRIMQGIHAGAITPMSNETKKKKCNTWICDWCGLFTSYDCVEKGGSTDWTPDSHRTIEEFAARCPKCTKEHGPVRLSRNSYPQGTF